MRIGSGDLEISDLRSLHTPPLTQGTAQRLQSLGTEKEAAQQACEAFLSTKPVGPAALQLPVVLNNVKNKYNDVQNLCRLYGEK